MSTLIVLAHPQTSSLCAHLARQIHAALGEDARLLDLYREGFDPVLSETERANYYVTPFEDSARLQDCTRLVLVFPTWWSGLPAILKGWIDRSFLPGVAYDHADDLSALTGRLHNLRDVLAITTCGGPFWVDYLVLRRPVMRALKWGIFKPCAPKARFQILSLYCAEAAKPEQVARFEAKITKSLKRFT